MTLDEFVHLVGVAHARCPFALDGVGAVRDAAGRCPVCAVASLLGRNPRGLRVEAYYIAPAICLTDDDATDLILAADTWLGRGPNLTYANGYPDYVNALRRRLLAAAGLTHPHPKEAPPCPVE